MGVGPQVKPTAAEPLRQSRRSVWVNRAARTSRRGRLYRNVTVGELEGGQAVRVTDYWGEPTVTPEWRQPLTIRPPPIREG
jgi:hypothetical protein